MVSVICSAAKSRVTGRSRSRDEVYVAALPLRATRGPAQLIMSSAYSLNLWDLQHFIVILKPSSPPLSQALVFDFQPQDPENIYVALAALTGRKIPGVVLMRKLRKLPTSKCWFVGYSRVDDAIDAAYKFNETWQSDLRIGYHDCRNYTNGLVEYLTGEKIVLEQLRRKQGSWRITGTGESSLVDNAVTKEIGSSLVIVSFLIVYWSKTVLPIWFIWSSSGLRLVPPSPED